MLDQSLVGGEGGKRFASPYLRSAFAADARAQELKREGRWAAAVGAQSYAEMTLLFADLVDFTRFAQGASAAVLAGVLDEVSARLDHSVDGQGLDRERTLSDAYLAAADLPDPLANHSIAVADKALDLAESLDRFNRLSRHQVRVRIGLNAGAKTFEI